MNLLLAVAAGFVFGAAAATVIVVAWFTRSTPSRGRHAKPPRDGSVLLADLEDAEVMP